MDIQDDYYWQSAQKLAQILGKCISIKPDDSLGLRKIPPETMHAALAEMCQTMQFMESDTILYKRLSDCNTQGPHEVKSYLKQTGMNIDELFSRFVQFEEAIIKDAKIDYDFGRIMIDAVETRRKYLYDTFLGNRAIDVKEIEKNVSAIRQEVCRVARDYEVSDRTIGSFIRGRLFSIAGAKIAVNNAALLGVFLPDLGHLDLALAVGAFMSEMAGGALMMLRPRTTAQAA
jgi:hypothetical protein